MTSSGYLEAMTQGSVFTMYEFDPNENPTKRKAFIFYDPTTKAFDPQAEQEETSGALFWCEPGRVEKRPERALFLGQLTDVYLEKETAIFRTDFARDAAGERCMSLISSVNNIEWNLEAGSAKEVNKWLDGISDILSSRGKEVVLTEENDGQGQGQAQAQPDELQRRQSRKYSVREEPPDASHVIRVLERGMTCFFFMEIDGRPSKVPRFLFFSHSPDGSSGRFYWCEPGMRVMKDEHSLPLHEITDVYLGKEKGLLLTEIAQDADDARCLTLRSETLNVELDIEAGSEDQVEFLVSGIRAVVEGSGKEMFGEPVQEERRASASQGSRGSQRGSHSQGQVMGSNPNMSNINASNINASNNVSGSNGSMNSSRHGSNNLSGSGSGSGHPALDSGGYGNGINSDELGVPMQVDRPYIPASSAIPPRQPSLQGQPQPTQAQQAQSRMSNSMDPVQGSNPFSDFQNQSHSQSSMSHQRAPSAGGAPAQEVRRFSVLDRNPSLAHSQGSGVSLGLSPKDLIRIMLQGGVFTFYEVRRDGSLSDRAQLLFYVEDSAGGQGTLCWCDPNTRERRMDMEIGVGELTDVYMGKQTDVFLHPEAAMAVEDRCFSLVAQDRAIHLEAQTAEQRTTWLFGINSILTAHGNQVVLDRNDGTPSQSLGGHLQDSGARRFSIQAGNYDQSYGADPFALAPAFNETFRSMTNGRMFTRFYSMNGGDYTEEVFLFYRPPDNSQAGLGALFFCEPGTRNEDPRRCLTLDNITDVFLGKQTEILLRPIAEHASDDRCFSILGRGGLILDLEAESAELLTAWLHGINELLRGSGKTVVLDDEQMDDGQGLHGRRFSIQPYSHSPHSQSNPFAGQSQSMYQSSPGMSGYGQQGILPPPPREPIGAQRDSGALTMSLTETMAMMAAGRNFIQFLRVNGRVVRQTIFMFFQETPQGQGPGLLYWCPPGIREAVPERALPLEAITDVYLGKQTATFADPMCLECEEESCFTVVSDIIELNLVAESAYILTAWLQGINTILSFNGKKIVFDDDDEPGPQFPAGTGSAAGSLRRRFSVADASGVSPETLADPKVQGMMRGATFTAYENFPRPAVRKLTLFYQQDDTRAGSVYYCVPGTRVPNPSQRLPIHQLTDIFVGKHNKAFNHTVARAAIEERCFSLIGRHVELNLEADSQEVLDAWIEGLRLLLMVSGKKVVVEEEEEAGSAPGTGVPMGFNTLQRIGTGPTAGAMGSNGGPFAGTMVNTLGGFQPRKLSIQVHHLPAALPRSPEETMKLLSARRDTLLSIPNHDVVRMMMEGRVFMAYFAPNLDYNNANVEGVRKPMRMFYKPNSSSPGGRLCWCEPDRKEELPGSSLSLDRLEQVYLGKETGAFRTAVGAQADPGRCFSLLGGGGMQVNLEAESREIVSAWLFGINSLLDQAGKKVILDQDLDRERERERERVRQMEMDSLRRREREKSGRRGSDRRDTARRYSINNSKGRNYPLTTTTNSKWLSFNAQSIQKGTPLVHFHFDSIDRVRRQEVTAWWEDHRGEDCGAMCWEENTGRSDNRRRGARSATGSIRVADIKEIQVGKMSRLLRSNIANDAVESRCFSVKLHNREEHAFEAPNMHTLTQWVMGLSDVLSVNGSEIGQTDFISAEGRIRERSDSRRKFSVLSAPYTVMNPLPVGLFPRFPQQTMEQLKDRRPTLHNLANNEVIRMMTHGSIFTGYGENRRGDFVKKHLLVFYNPAHGRCGTLYWCPPGQKIESPLCRISLVDITDVYIGKHTDVLESVEARSAVEDHCVSLVSHRLSIDLEAKNVAQLNAWLFGIHSMLIQEGKRLLQGDDEKRLGTLGPKGLLTVSSESRQLVQLSKKHDAQAGIPAKLKLGSPLPPNTESVFFSRQSVIPVDQQKLANLMQKGRIFMQYTARKAKPVMVFYQPPSPQTGTLGALYWCSPDKPSKNAKRMIPLHEVTGIFVKKDTDVFRSPVAAKADPDKCASIIGKNNELHIEAATVEQMVAWLLGVNTILVQGGKKLYLDKPDHASVTSPTAQNPRAVAQAMASGGQINMSFNDTIRMMTNGRTFTRYFMGGGGVRSQHIFLFYSPRQGSAGTLYWCEPGERVENQQNSIPMHTITDVYLGKQTDCLNDRIAAHAHEDVCFSIRASGFSLDLEADEPEQVAAWMFGIDSVMKNSAGKAFTMETREKRSNSGHVSTSDAQRRFSVMNRRDEDEEKEDEDRYGNERHRERSRERSRERDRNYDRTYDRSYDRSYDRDRGNQDSHNHDRERELERDRIARDRRRDEYNEKMANRSRPRESGVRSFSVYAGQRPMEKEPASEVVASMVRGHVFWAATGDIKSPRRTEIHLFFDPDEGKYGCLYWCGANERRKLESCSLPLHRITDIFVGKQTPVLQSNLFDRAPEENCFSLVGSDAELHIEAATALLAKEWLAGINHIITSFGTKVILEEDSMSDTGERRQRFSLRASAVAEARQADSRQSVQTLIEGTVFTRYSEQNSEEIMLFYSKDDGTRLGSLYWCDPRGRREEDIEQCLPLHEITDLYSGKQSQVLSSPIARRAKEAHSLTIRGKKLELHLEGPTETARHHWLDGIRTLLTQAGRKVILEREDGLGASSNNGRSDARRRFSVTGPEDNPAVKAMIEGADFTLYQNDRGREKRSIITLYYDPSTGKSGSLFWCEKGSAAMKQMHLHQISDLFVGKQRFDNIAHQARQECCMSLVGMQSELDLEAPTQQQLEMWVSGLNHILTTTGRKVVLESQEPVVAAGSAHFSQRRFSVTNYAHPAELATLSPSDIMTQLARRRATLMGLAAEPTLSMMEQGQLFDGYFYINGRVVKEDTTVRYSNKDHALYWQAASRAGKEYGPLRLGEVMEVLLGMLSTAITPPPRSGDPTLLLALLTVDKELNLGAKTHDQLRAWVFGLNSLLAQGGKEILLDERQGEGHRYWVSDPTDRKREPTKEEATAVQKMTQGGAFRIYHPDPNGGSNPIISNGFLFYVPDAESGSIYWSETQARVESPDRRIRLFNVTDLYVGKQNPIFGPQPPEANCCSISSQDHTLHIEASSPEQLDEWVKGLNYILSSTGKTLMVDDDEPSKRSNTPRRSDSRRKRYSVTEYHLPPGLPTNPNDTLSRLAKRRPTLLEMSNQETIAMMEKGRVFRHFRMEGNRPRVQDVLLYYRRSADHHDAGGLYWSPLDGEDHENFMALVDLQEVYLGKDRPAFGAAPDADDTRCFTLVSGRIEVDLEAESMPMLSAWLFGINSILFHSGRHVEFEEGSDQTKRRYSVIATQTGTLGLRDRNQLSSGGSGPQRQLSSGGGGTQRISPRPSPRASPRGSPRPVQSPAYEDQQSYRDANEPSPEQAVEQMMKGDVFTVYLPDGTTAEYLLFYDQEKYAIYYCQPDKRELIESQCLSLDKITDIFCGKQTQNFMTHPQAEDGQGQEGGDPADKCFSLVTTEISLDLEAPDEETSSVWMTAINHVLTSTGKQILTDDDAPGQE